MLYSVVSNEYSFYKKLLECVYKPGWIRIGNERRLALLELLVQELLDVRVDDFALGSLELGQDALLAEVVEDGPRLVGEDLQAVADRLRLVVLPLDEWLSRDVVPALDLGRAEEQVVDPPRAGVDEAVLDAVDDRLEGHVQVDHDVDRRLALQSQSSN